MAQANWSLKLKGRERRKAKEQKSLVRKISVEQRMREEVYEVMYNCFIQVFSIKVNVPKIRNGTCLKLLKSDALWGV